MQTLTLLYLIILGVLPSLIWLSFFLKEDCEPEPKSLLAKTFLMGMIISPLAVILQSLAAYGATCLKIDVSLASCAQALSLDLFSTTYRKVVSSPGFFLWAAFIEETVKLYAVWLIAVKSREFDEPTDAIIYLITASLGFAAIENILVVRQTLPDGLNAALGTISMRFFGATLLHALSSGLMGYFLAMAWLFREHKVRLVGLGLAIASLFHFTFNIALAAADTSAIGIGYASALLMVMAALVYVLFVKIRRKYCRVTNFT